MYGAPLWEGNAQRFTHRLCRIHGAAPSLATVCLKDADMKKTWNDGTAFIIAIVCLLSVVSTDCRIPDDVVVVDVRPVLLRGHQGKLRCEFYGPPYAVYWLKGDTLNDATTQVDWHRNLLSGEKYHAGLMTMDANYSLIIYTVSDDDAGRYYCRVSDHRGVLIWSYTDVSVKAPPPPDFLRVTGCLSSDCSLSYNPEGTALRCQAENVEQDLINIYWLPNGGNQEQNPVPVRNNDGTQNIYANINLTAEMSGTFACVAEIKSTHSEVKRITVTIPTPITTSSSTTVTTTVTAATIASTRSPASRPKRNNIGIQSILCYLMRPSLCRS
ncbi:uncharacterized protein [Diadema setosum]|uniref:uncharacterized protein n=1 Tax=Diadema setosum TaxID=31175 RepID=UPI003B3B3C9A